MDHLKSTPDHRASQLPVQQRLVLFILSILSIDVPSSAANRFSGTWLLLPIGHKDPHGRLAVRLARNRRQRRSQGEPFFVQGLPHNHPFHTA